MEPPRLRHRSPEAGIKARIISLLEARGWLVVTTHGNMFQSGLPDLWCAHRLHGVRWIEVKNPAAYHFTPAQERLFRRMAECQVGIWIMFDASEEAYQSLWKPPNWAVHLGHSRRHI